MLYEDDVVSAVAAYLRSEGYTIRQALSAAQRGVDIVAVKNGSVPIELHVEAKGAGSSKAGTGRYGQQFNSSEGAPSGRRPAHKSASSGRNCTPGQQTP